MPQIDLANIKTRLLGFGAVMIVGQILSTVIGGPGAAAATAMGGPIAVVGGTVLSTIVASLTGNLVATDIDKKIVDRLAKNKHILDNHDLTLSGG